MAEMTRQLAGKVAVVTGASQGLGEHAANWGAPTGNRSMSTLPSNTPPTPVQREDCR